MKRPFPALPDLEKKIIGCRLCPRLVRYREMVAREKRRQFQECEYWGRPLAGFGDPRARLLLVGLAPAAHGGNRTGRMFTGDRSGDWLIEALHRFNFASQPTSRDRRDGLELNGCYITAVVRCAPPQNRPTRQEQEHCRPYLLEEILLLKQVRVVIALGGTAFSGYLKARKELGLPLPSPLPRFSHGGRTNLAEGVILLGSYHPSQQNTFTGRLTKPMFYKIFSLARQVLSGGRTPADSRPAG